MTRHPLPKYLVRSFVCAAAGLLIAGCTSSGEHHYYGESTSSSPTATAKATSSTASSSSSAKQPETVVVHQDDSSSVRAYNVTRIKAPEDAHYTLAYPTGDRRTSALLIEQVAPGQVQVGRDVTYQLKVTNLTDRPIRGVRLLSRQSEHLRLNSIAATTRPASDGQVVYDVGDLAPNESRSIEVVGTPDRVGPVDATYAVTMQPPEFRTSLNVVNPTLKVTAQGPTNADICADIVYRYTVTNTGTGLARNVRLDADLLEGMATTEGKSTLSADLGDIPQGESRDVVAKLKATRTGRHAVQAIVRSDRQPLVKSDILTTTSHAPALAMTIKGPTQEYVGRPIPYTLAVTNTGDAPARQVLIKLNASNIGQVTTIRRADSDNGAELAADATAGPGAATLGTIAPGETRTVEVTAEGASGGTLAVTAVATAPCAKEISEAAHTQLLTVPALLLQAVDEADPVRVGDNVVYTVSVTNQGSGPDANVHVTATLPDNTEFVSARGTTDARAVDHKIDFSPVARLAPKETATWKVTARVLHPGDAQFKVTANSDSLKTPAEKSEPTRLY